ncbi:hypothetical protein KAW18_13730 [candidate division WOR-3 bacterium]|nr:hypothetical protein [candidate division WOR-3 bacterium]
MLSNGEIVPVSMEISTTLSGISTDVKSFPPLSDNFVMPKITNIEKEREDLRKILGDGKDCILVFDDEYPEIKETKRDNTKGIFKRLKTKCKFWSSSNIVTLPYVHLRSIPTYPQFYHD